MNKQPTEEQAKYNPKEIITAAWNEIFTILDKISNFKGRFYLTESLSKLYDKHIIELQLHSMSVTGNAIRNVLLRHLEIHKPQEQEHSEEFLKEAVDKVTNAIKAFNDLELYIVTHLEALPDSNIITDSIHAATYNGSAIRAMLTQHMNKQKEKL